MVPYGTIANEEGPRPIDGIDLLLVFVWQEERHDPFTQDLIFFLVTSHDLINLHLIHKMVEIAAGLYGAQLCVQFGL